MSDKHLVRLLVALMVGCVWSATLRAANLVTNELKIANGEHWWGGAAGFGTKMPFDVSSAVRIDLTVDNYSQQCDSLLISDQGRIAYSPKPVSIEVTNGVIRLVTDGEFEVRQEGDTLREAFLYASRTWFPPSGKMPAELFFTAPQYNTWVELNYQQNQESILKYARDFLAQGCPPGVIMIDDTWQVAYGEWDFDLRRFPDPKAMCDELHRMGFKVMLWICPWVGMDTPAYRRIARGHNPNDYRGYPTKGGFRMLRSNPELPAPNQWWNGCSALLDFTHPNARAWFTEQLDRLAKDYGIDGFKFDGGEFEHYTDDAFSLERGLSRAEEAWAYALNALKYPYSEYRNGWHLGGQPIVQRLIDKPHTWDAVRQLIPDMMAAGLLGYQFVCPDMAGGGIWTAFLPGAKIDQEIFVRSVQVHALCGQMQFSASPWRLLDAEHQEAVRKAVNLRQSFVPYILDLVRTCAKSGEPMIRNLEYAYPHQGYAGVRDQFLLGEELLVAPQMEPGGKSRKVLIPPGSWKCDDGTVVRGPCSVQVETPIDRIPHYVRMNEGCDKLLRFWMENDGKAVRRLPVWIAPENVFWTFCNQDFADGMKTFDRLVDEGLTNSTYNCITLTLRCNPELGDDETLAAVKRCIDKAHTEGVKVYMDTDPRIARREFFSKWPEDRQGVAEVVLATPKDGTAMFASLFKPSQDHMSWGAADAYRPLSGHVAAAWAVKRRVNGELDFTSRRRVETSFESTIREWREKSRDGSGHTDFSEVTVKGSAKGLAEDEALVVVTVADYLSIDVFSPRLVPFCRDLLVKYRGIGADGGMRDEWGFIAEHKPDWKHFFYSPHFAAAYRKVSGRDMLTDFPLMAFGPKGDVARTAAIGAYMKLTLSRNAEIERAFYDADKEVFGEDVYVCKHATWSSDMGAAEICHNGLDWWQATRDWAQGDELTPIYALNGMAKKFGGPVWLNEGYTRMPEHNVFRVWTYALCGGRQVYHGLFGARKYDTMPWEESRVRKSTDLLAPGNVRAQSRVRLTGLITRAQTDCPLAFVFGHEGLVDWSDPGFGDHGRAQIAALLANGWWSDAYPASEFELGTFAVDADGWLRVGRQRYAALATWRLRPSERKVLEALTRGRNLKTRIFDGGEVKSICAYLEQSGSTRQPIVKARTGAGPLYPEPDGLLRLIDGTAIRIKADWKHPQGLPIEETIESNGVKVEIAAEGIAAVRAEGGEIVALAAGGLRRAKGPGLMLDLDGPEDVAFLKIDGVWHGVWQTAQREASIPAELGKLTSHWIRLQLPAELL